MNDKKLDRLEHRSHHNRITDLEHRIAELEQLVEGHRHSMVLSERSHDGRLTGPMQAKE